MINKPNKRRIFITYDNITYHKLFSLTQSKNGDIYCSWSGFSESQWIYPSEIDGDMQLKATSTPIDSLKLSIHNSGIVKFRHNDFQFDPLRTKGIHLVDFENKNAGLRHLFTIVVNDPQKNIENDSPYGSRPGDFTIVAKNSKSFVTIFYAIPQLENPLKTGFQLIFDNNLSMEDRLLRIGVENISLGYHDIAMIIYEFSDKFPKNPLIFYSDGLTIPMPFEVERDDETKLAKLKVVNQIPAFNYENNQLSITLSFEDESI